MNGNEERVTTENEMPRRVAKVEEMLAALVAEHKKARRDPFDRITTAVAIVALAAIEGLAIHKGADGAMFMPVIALIAALAGIKMKDVFGGKK